MIPNARRRLAFSLSLGLLTPALTQAQSAEAEVPPEPAFEAPDLAAAGPPPEVMPPPPAPKPKPAATEVRTTVVGKQPKSMSMQFDGGKDAESPPTVEEPGDSRVLHGFRLGYLFITNHDEPVDPDDPDSSLEKEFDVESPHQFLIGYELMHRVTRQQWLNVLLVGNVLVAGLEQSKFFPSSNLLLGFEFNRSFQLGVGVNLVPTKDKPAHMVTAAGWTPKVGDLYVPVHFFYIPDIDSNHRLGVTVGVNWGA